MTISREAMARIRSNLIFMVITAAQILDDFVAEKADPEKVSDAISFLSRNIRFGCSFEIEKICEAQKLVPVDMRTLPSEEITLIARKIQKLLVG